MSPDDLVRQIAADRDHGATALVLMALRGIAEIAGQRQEQSRDRKTLVSLIENLQVCRPSMAALDRVL